MKNLKKFTRDQIITMIIAAAKESKQVYKNLENVSDRTFVLTSDDSATIKVYETVNTKVSYFTIVISGMRSETKIHLVNGKVSRKPVKQTEETVEYIGYINQVWIRNDLLRLVNISEETQVEEEAPEQLTAETISDQVENINAVEVRPTYEGISIIEVIDDSATVYATFRSLPEAYEVLEKVRAAYDRKTAESQEAATAEETAATIETVDVEISRDENFREHTMTTKSVYHITYSDGTSENIETINTGSQEEVPAYLVDFLRTAKHETISNCYWYEEILYTATATTVKIEKPVEAPEAETEKAETTEAPAMGCIYEVKFDDEDITVLSIWRLPNDYYRVDTDSRSCKISSSYNTFSEAVESYKYTRNKKIEGSATAEETYNRLTEEETAMISDATETPEETEQFNDIMYTYDIYYNESDFATESDRYFNTIKECIDNLKYHEIKYFKIYEYNKLIDMVTKEVYI